MPTYQAYLGYLGPRIEGACLFRTKNYVSEVQFRKNLRMSEKTSGYFPSKSLKYQKPTLLVLSFGFSTERSLKIEIDTPP